MKTSITYTFKLTLIILLALGSIHLQAQDPSAILDLESTTQGMLAPRMNTSERLALPGIHTPATSLLVYDTDTKSFWYWEDAMWNELGASTSGGLMTAGGSVSPDDTINNTLPPVVSTINLTGSGVIDADTKIEVCLNIEHTYTGDLDISLKAPDGSTTIDLTTDNGDGGDNFTNTCFSDDATTAITAIVAADAPFTGRYTPEQALSTFIGQNIAGAWELTVVDDAGGDNGNLISWSINIGTGEPIIANLISDGDGDTKIQVEESLDEDKIRFDIRGTEKIVFSRNTDGRLLIEPKDNFFNTMLGDKAGENLSGSAYSNTLIGAGAGVLQTTALENTIVGTGAGSKITTQSINTLIGRWAGRDAENERNTYIGGYAGVRNVTGVRNTYLGAFTGEFATGGSRNVFIGYNVGSNESGNDKLYIDNSSTSAPLIWGDFSTNQLMLFGDVGIGNTTDTKTLATGYKLSVKGKIACEEVLVDLEGDWPDYVFKPEYELKTLEQVKNHIAEKGHLPGVPSAQQIEDNGIVLGEMNKVLMEKIEELTLYILQQDEKLKSQEARLQKLENK